MMIRDNIRTMQPHPLAAGLATVLAIAASAACVRTFGEEIASRTQIWNLVPPIAREQVRAQIETKGAPNRSAPKTHQVQSCSEGALRQAILNAGNGDVVDMPVGCSVITLTAGSIPITVDNLSLVGPGADIFTIDGGASSGRYDRIFNHYGTGTLKIDAITITDSSLVDSVDARGGCVESNGAIQLTHSVLTHCYVGAAIGHYADGGALYAKHGVSIEWSDVESNSAYSPSTYAYGGAVFSKGGLLVSYSTLSNNVAHSVHSSRGGAVYAFGGDITITGSTISNNEAARCGGLSLPGDLNNSHAEITNSTISDNFASEYVGGAGFGLPVTIGNTTIAWNVAGHAKGAGIYVDSGGTLVATSSIFASNVSLSGYETDISMDGSISPLSSKNIIVRSTNVLPEGTITDCPRLGPLADNGGPTLTRAPLIGSPAIDNGSNPSQLEFDQRQTGFPRTFGPQTDIGATEWEGDAQDEIYSSRFELGCD